MAFEQKFKLWLTSFNPLWYTGALPDCPDYSGITEWSSLTAEAKDVGEDEIATDFTDDITGFIIRFSGHDKCYLVSDFDSGTLTLSEPIIDAVADDETIYVYQWIDITDLDMDLSEWEKERETDNYEFIFDSQMRFKTANYHFELYNRQQYNTAFDTAQAYFNTRNEQDSDRDNKYIRIEAYYNGVWNQIYAGRITPDDMVLDAEKRELSFETESSLYSLKDIYFDTVKGIYNNHRYTDDNHLTQTPSGKITDIIWKIFKEIGIQSKIYSASGAVVLDNEMTITITGHDIKAGELIYISDYGYPVGNRSYVVRTVDTNEITVKLIHDNDTLSAMTVTATRVLFPDYTKYFNWDHNGWNYDIDDCWFIPQLWHTDIIANMKCDDIMKIFNTWFLSYATIEYRDSIVYGSFKSYLSSGLSKKTFTKEDFISEFNLSPNWTKFNANGVEIIGQANYYDENTYPINVKYQLDSADEYAVGFTDDVYDKGSTQIDVSGLFNAPVFTVNSKVKFRSHETEYRITDVSFGHYITISPPLEQSLKIYEPVYQTSNINIQVEYPEMFALKLVYPDLYVANTDADDVLRYYNTATTIVDYTAKAIHNKTTLGKGISIIQPLPIGSYQAKPCGSQVVLVDNDGGTKYIQHGDTEYSSDEFNMDSHDHDIDYVATGFVRAFDDEDSLWKTFLLSFITSCWSNATPEYFRQIQRRKYELDDGGQYSNDRAYPERFSLYKLKTIDSSVSRVNESDGSEYIINGIYLNSDILNPFKNDYIYFSDDNSDCNIRKQLALGDDTIYDAFSGSAPAGSLPQGLSIGSGEGTGVGALYFVDANDNKLYYSELNGNYSTITDLAGGGVSTIGAGDSCNAGDIDFGNVIDCHKCYDNMISLVSDSGLYLCDNTHGVVYCIAESEYFGQVYANDFIHSWNSVDGSIDGDQPMIDISWNTAKLAAEYYSERRRKTSCSLIWEDYAEYELSIGDRITLNRNILMGENLDVNFWIDKIVIDFKDRIIKLRLLEDTRN